MIDNTHLVVSNPTTYFVSLHQDNDRLYLGTEISALINGFDSLTIFDQQRVLLVLGVDCIVERQTDKLILDLTSTVGLLTNGQYQVTINYKDEQQQWQTFEQLVFNYYEIKLEATIISDIPKDIGILPVDITFSQETNGDLIISSNDHEWLKAVHILYLQNVSYQGWIMIDPENHQRLATNEILIKRSVFLHEMAIPVGDYQVVIEADHYDDYVSSEPVLIFIGAEYAPSDVRVFQDDLLNLSIVSTEIDWVHAINEIAFYDQQQLIDMVLVNTEPFIAEHGLVIEFKSFHKLFTKLISGTYTMVIKADDFAKKVLELTEIRTINQQQPIDQTTILLNKQQDLEIEAEDVLWLNGIYGMQLLSEHAVIGELQWRFERYGVERTEHRMTIKRIRWSQLINEPQMLMIQLLHLDQKQNATYPIPLEFHSSQLALSEFVSVFQHTNGELLIQCLDQDWLKAIHTISLDNDQSFNLSLWDRDGYYFEQQILHIRYDYLLRQSGVGYGVYQVTIQADSYLPVTVKDVLISKGLLVLPDDITIVQSPTMDLQIASKEQAYLNAINQVKVFDESNSYNLDYSAGWEVSSEGILSISYDCLAQVGITDGEYKIKIKADGYLTFNDMLELKTDLPLGDGFQVTVSGQQWILSPLPQVTLMRYQWIEGLDAQHRPLWRYALNVGRFKHDNNVLTWTMDDTIVPTASVMLIDHQGKQWITGKINRPMVKLASVDKVIVEQLETGDLLIKSFDEQWLAGLYHLEWVNQQWGTSNERHHQWTIQKTAEGIIIPYAELLVEELISGGYTLQILSTGFEPVYRNIYLKTGLLVPPMVIEFSSSAGILHIQSRDVEYLKQITKLEISLDHPMRRISLGLVEHPLLLQGEVKFNLEGWLKSRPIASMDYTINVIADGYLSYSGQCLINNPSQTPPVLVKINQQDDLLVMMNDESYYDQLMQLTLTKLDNGQSVVIDIAAFKEEYIVDGNVMIPLDYQLRNLQLTSGKYQAVLQASGYLPYHRNYPLWLTKGVDNTTYIVSLALRMLPYRVQYIENQPLVLDGLVVVANFSDGSQQVLEDYLVSDCSMTVGLHWVAISYQQFTTGFEVTVVAKQLVKVLVTSKPDKLVYLEGDELQTLGMVVEAHYDNQTIEVVSDYQLQGYDALPGLKRIMVWFQQCYDSFHVKVTLRQLIKLSITSLPTKLTYLEGEGFDATGLEISALYNNNTSQILDDYVLSGYDATPGSKQLIATYHGLTTKFNVVVTPRQLISIHCVPLIEPLVYLEGTAFDPTQVKVIGFYNNNTQEAINNAIISGYDSTPGLKAVSFFYEGKTDVINVTVTPKALIGISVVHQPLKVEYLEGETFNRNGMVVMAHYNNATQQVIDEYQLHTTSQLNTVGVMDIGLTYQDQSTVIKVKVLPKQLTKIKVDALPNLTYLEGEQFNPTGLQVKAYYSNQTSELVKDFEYAGYEANPGIKRIQVSYFGKYDHFDVHVLAKSLSEIKIISKPIRLVYLEGEEFDSTGLVVMGYYNNNTSGEVKADSITGYNKTPGNHELTVNVLNKQARFFVEVTPKILTNIRISKLPLKLDYLEGETFDKTGLEVMGFYNNNTFELVDGYVISGFDSSVGNKRIVVTYQGKSDAFSLEVAQRQLLSIQAFLKYDDLKLLEGDDFDPHYLKVVANYSNKTQEVVEQYVLTGYEKTPGSKILNVQYGGKNDQVVIEVAPRSLDYIIVSVKPKKLVYLEGESFEPEGLTVIAHYNNHTSEQITDWQYQGYDPLPGIKTITVSYLDCSDSFTVKVLNKQLLTLRITKKPYQLIYKEGEALDLHGLEVEATYNNGTTALVTNYTISGYDATVGFKKLTVMYEGKSDAFNIEVKARQLVGIGVVRKPNRLIYLEGDKFDRTGLVVNGFYDNQSVEPMFDYLISGYEATPGMKAITITIGNLTDVFNVEVKARQLIGIKIMRKPDKLVYLEGDTFNSDGLLVHAYYNNNTQEEIKNYLISGYDPSPGTKRITVSLDSSFDAFNVSVTPKQLIAISVDTLPDKTKYLEGDNLDLTGLVIKAHFNNQSFDYLVNYTCEGYDSTPGIKTIRIIYRELLTSFAIEVFEKSLTRIAIIKRPLKLEYLEGDNFNPRGMEVKAYYNNKTEATINDYLCLGYDANPGTKTVTVNYQNQSDQLMVNVVSKQLSKINILSRPDKMIYLEGDNFESAGLAVEALYNNGTREPITDYQIQGYESTPGIKRLSVVYQGKKDYLSIKVTPRQLSGIEISKLPHKIYYLEGDDFTIDGLEVLAHYNNHTSETIDQYTVSGFHPRPGTKVITVFHAGMTATFNVEVAPRRLTHLEAKLVKPSNSVVMEGTKLDNNDFQVTGYYNNGTTEEITNFTIGGYDGLPGIKQVSINYEAMESIIHVEVLSKQLKQLVITTKPYKQTYLEGESLNPDGLLVSAIYNNNTQETVVGYLLGSHDGTPGKKKITVTYLTKQTYFWIEVLPKQLTHIRVESTGQEHDYLEGDSFDRNSILVMAYYSNQTKDVITDYTVSGYDATPGQKQVMITYQGVNTGFQVKVRPKTLQSVVITKKPTKIQYREAEELDLSGMEVIAYYDNHTQQVLYDYQVSGYQSSPGLKTVAVSYQGKQDYLSIDVVPKQLMKLVVERLPEKTSYIEGETLQLAGMIVVGHYNNGTTSVIDQYEISGYDSKVGTKTINITYQNQRTSFKVTVSQRQLIGIKAQSLSGSVVKMLEGLPFNRDLIEVIGLYDNQTTTEIKNYEIDSYDTTPGNKYIMIRYQELEDAMQVMVVTKELVEINARIKPGKSTIKEGYSLENSAVVVTATYNNQTTANVEDFQLGPTPTQPGEHQILVSYLGLTTTVEVKVTARKINRLEITKLPVKRLYLEAEPLNTAGLEVTAYYDNQSFERVDNYSLSGYTGKVGTNQITVAYRQKQVDFTVEVNPRVLTGIRAIVQQDPLIFYQGELFDPLRLEVTAFYNNLTQEKITDFEVIGYDGVIGLKKVEIRYQQQSAFVNVKVVAKTMTGIVVTTLPNKVKYRRGESLQTAGMNISAVYDNGSQSLINDYQLSGFDSSTVGLKTITVTYSENQGAALLRLFRRDDSAVTFTTTFVVEVI